MTPVKRPIVKQNQLIRSFPRGVIVQSVFTHSCATIALNTTMDMQDAPLHLPLQYRIVGVRIRPIGRLALIQRNIFPRVLSGYAPDPALAPSLQWLNQHIVVSGSARLVPKFLLVTGSERLASGSAPALSGQWAPPARAGSGASLDTPPHPLTWHPDGMPVRGRMAVSDNTRGTSSREPSAVSRGRSIAPRAPFAEPYARFPKRAFYKYRRSWFIFRLMAERDQPRLFGDASVTCFLSAARRSSAYCAPSPVKPLTGSGLTGEPLSQSSSSHRTGGLPLVCCQALSVLTSYLVWNRTQIAERRLPA